MMSESLDMELEMGKDPNKRPAFITVLCILTFVGCGITFISAVYSMATFESSLRSLEISSETLENMGNGFFDGMKEQVIVTKKWGMLAYGISMGSALICLFGALQMWKLKKSGFYIYIFGQILPFFITFGLMSAALSGIFLIAAVAGTLFTVAFIIMYAVNLKHLR